MTIRRESIVRTRLLTLIQEHPGATQEAGGQGTLDDPVQEGSGLTRRNAIAIFEASLQSRLQDLEARKLKDQGLGYYTIGSCGHEANAVFGNLLRTTDVAFLHYRSGAFLAARQKKGRAETPIFDAMLSFVVSAEDPVSGGRHKVLGSHGLLVPPQTSTIASHLPKAVGYAYALARMDRLEIDGPDLPEDSIVYCSFGDASANHATAQAGFTAATAAVLHRQPCPVIFVCEDNGLGISVRTPKDYIRYCYQRRPGLIYYEADGRDLASTYDLASAAIEECRKTRKPIFFHLRTIRLLGHAGSDVETSYMRPEEIAANEEKDPLLSHADLLLRSGAIEKEALLALHEDLERRIHRAGKEAVGRPKLVSKTEVMAPLQHPEPDALQIPVADPETRTRVFDGHLPEKEGKPRHLAHRLALGLKDILAAYPQALVFGEDVARKGGVYHVTADLNETFGTGRVFNTILDETTILGLAQGLAQAGCLAIPEIQYLAYIHNAIDQIRGEAASLKFFSNGCVRNPMVVRVAGLAYQKGFGGHFHNDNSLGALLEIPGLVIAAPSRADDAVRMLRTCAAAAWQHGSVCIFLEPIALYMQKDLHQPGDGLWQFPYPEPGEALRLETVRAYGTSDDDQLTILSYANGLHMSLKAQALLAGQGLRARVLDLQWLAPLPLEEIRRHALATGRLLLVDECRRSGGGPSPVIMAELADLELPMRRVVGEDSYIPLGPAADLVLVQVGDILEAARMLCSGKRP